MLSLPIVLTEGTVIPPAKCLACWVNLSHLQLVLVKVESSPG